MKLRRETPYRAQKRNQGYMKARGLGAVKGAYDTVVQGTRDLGAVVDYLANKAMGKSEEEAGASLNKYYDKTKGLDKVDEALVEKAYDVAGNNRAPIAVKRGEGEGAAITMIGGLKSLTKGGAARNATKVEDILTATQKAKKANLNNYAKYMDIVGPEGREPFGLRGSNIPAYQQKIYSAYKNAKGPKWINEKGIKGAEKVPAGMKEYIDVPAKRTSTSEGSFEMGYDGGDVYHMNDMIKPLDNKTINTLKKYIDKNSADAYVKEARTKSLEDMLKEWEAIQN